MNPNPIPLSVFHEVVRRGPSTSILPPSVFGLLAQLAKELTDHMGSGSNTVMVGSRPSTVQPQIRISHMARKQLTSNSSTNMNRRGPTLTSVGPHVHTTTAITSTSTPMMTLPVTHKCGIDGQVDQIRLCLNKLSDKNYRDMQARICSIMDQLFPSDVSDEFDLTIEKDRIKQSTYDICSHTKFFSQYYSQVYVSLCQRYSWLQSYLDIQFDAYVPSFERIQNINSDTHYDLFCEMNKRNEQRKANATFFVHLSEQGLIDPLRIQQVADALLQQTMDHVMYQEADSDHWRTRLDEISEHVSILVQGPLGLSTQGKEQVHVLAWMKAKECRCLSSKAIFKYMAIEDSWSESE